MELLQQVVYRIRPLPDRRHQPREWRVMGYQAARVGHTNYVLSVLRETGQYEFNCVRDVYPKNQNSIEASPSETPTCISYSPTHIHVYWSPFRDNSQISHFSVNVVDDMIEWEGDLLINGRDVFLTVSNIGGSMLIILYVPELDIDDEYPCLENLIRRLVHAGLHTSEPTRRRLRQVWDDIRHPTRVIPASAGAPLRDRMCRLFLGR